jgi:ankyrin repeat protein
MKINNLYITILLLMCSQSILGMVPQDAFFEAIKERNIAKAKQLVEAGADINATNREDYTALGWAAKTGDLPMAKFLIESGANVNAQSSGDRTPLHFATLGEHLEMIEYLIKKGADVYAEGTNGRNAIDLAIKIDSNTNNHKVEEFLLEQAAKIKPTEELLTYAVKGGYFDIVKYLVSNGVDIYASDSIGRTAIDWARWYSNKQIEKFLIEQAAKIKPTQELLKHAVTGGYFDIVKALLESNKVYPTQELLEHAINGGYLDTVKALLESNKVYPTQELLKSAIEGGYLDIVKALLESNKVYPTQALLKSAIEAGRFNIVKALLESNKVYPTQKLVKTAIEAGRFNIVKALLESNKVDPTPELLKSAIEADSPEMVKYLISNGADIYAKDKDGMTAMDWAKRSPDYYVHLKQVEKILREQEAKIKPTQELLNSAIKEGDFDIVKVLLETNKVYPTQKDIALAKSKWQLTKKPIYQEIGRILITYYARRKALERNLTEFGLPQELANEIVGFAGLDVLQDKEK